MLDNVIEVTRLGLGGKKGFLFSCVRKAADEGRCCFGTVVPLTHLRSVKRKEMERIVIRCI